MSCKEKITHNITLLNCDVMILVNAMHVSSSSCKDANSGADVHNWASFWPLHDTVQTQKHATIFGGKASTIPYVVAIMLVIVITITTPIEKTYNSGSKVLSLLHISPSYPKQNK